MSTVKAKIFKEEGKEGERGRAKIGTEQRNSGENGTRAAGEDVEILSAWNSHLYARCAVLYTAVYTRSSDPAQIIAAPRDLQTPAEASSSFTGVTLWLEKWFLLFC